MRTTNFLWMLCFMLIVFACGRDTSGEAKKDTPTQGNISIAVDESFKPIVEELVNSFEAEYPKATFKVLYRTEGECINLLMKDSVRLVVVSRSLTEAEKNIFKPMGYEAAIIPIAIDALAFINNLQNSDSTLTYEQIQQILKGNIVSWNQVDANMPDEKINLVFDGNNSSSLRYLRDSVNHGNKLASNCFASDASNAVIQYIEENKFAIGVIGVNWINSKIDSETANNFSHVKMIKVKPLPGMPGDSMYHAPVPYNIAYRHYPFLRMVYIVSREYYTGLGTGFATYCATDKGQTIIARSGMLPVNKSLRVVTINPSF